MVLNTSNDSYKIIKIEMYRNILNTWYPHPETRTNNPIAKTKWTWLKYLKKKPDTQKRNK